jgi:hypothetical protein
MGDGGETVEERCALLGRSFGYRRTLREFSFRMYATIRRRVLSAIFSCVLCVWRFIVYPRYAEEHSAVDKIPGSGGYEVQKLLIRFDPCTSAYE